MRAAARCGLFVIIALICLTIPIRGGENVEFFFWGARIHGNAEIGRAASVFISADGYEPISESSSMDVVRSSKLIGYAAYNPELYPLFVIYDVSIFFDFSWIWVETGLASVCLGWSHFVTGEYHERFNELVIVAPHFVTPLMYLNTYVTAPIAIYVCFGEYGYLTRQAFAYISHIYPNWVKHMIFSKRNKVIEYIWLSLYPRPLISFYSSKLSTGIYGQGYSECGYYGCSQSSNGWADVIEKIKDFLSPAFAKRGIVFYVCVGIWSIGYVTILAGAGSVALNEKHPREYPNWSWLIIIGFICMVISGCGAWLLL